MLRIKYSDLIDAVTSQPVNLVPAFIDINQPIVIEENDQQHEFRTKEDFLTFLRNRGLYTNDRI